MTIISILILMIFIKAKDELNKIINKDKRNIIKTLSMISAVVFLVFSFFAPYFFTSTSIGKSLITGEHTGHIGDTIGGIMSPFIAIAGVLLTFLAFYIQYQANKKVQNQFIIQQFESQFYEMLHLHRENLNEMNIEGYSYEYNDKSKEAKKDSKKVKLTTGKKVFVTMLKEFEAIHLIATKTFMSDFKSLEQKDKDKIAPSLNQLILEHSYFVLFNGINIYTKNIERFVNADGCVFIKSTFEKFKDELENIKTSHLDDGIKIHYTYLRTGSLQDKTLQSRTLWLSFNYKPFSGHQSRLAHYYRHLFQTVKFVVKQDESIISYEKKRDYLRILRSMLSNHEQILMYYNWLANFGSQWEQKDIEKRKIKNGNYFFTDFRMIHNIPNDLLLEEFKLERIFNEDFSNYRYELNRKDEDDLFELIKITNNHN
ncbi:putative phage abortive infection protein [Myroides guanonis]|nr:putative phage abortive infection protein [Myroides guanonis]